MKALTMTLVAALTLIATTSNAFCLLKFQNELRRDSNKGNFYTQQLAKNTALDHSSPNSKSAPVQTGY